MSEPVNPPVTSRRDLLTAATAAAAGLALIEEVASAQENPAETVGDRTTSIKITALRPWRVHAKVYLEIQTNHGVTGWGEITGTIPTVSMELATSLFSLLEGENPTRIEYLWQKLYRAHRNIRNGALMVHVLSAIDMALWDITGRLWGVPVYRLLGGPCRNRIRFYHSDKALKVPSPERFQHSGNPADIEKIVNTIRAAREKMGPDGAVMFDAHCGVPPATLIQAAGAIKAYDVLFIEEVAVPGNIEVFKRLKEAIDIPLATGERDRTIWGMIPYLTERCIDILQPDCAHTGGITQMKKIATLAETYFVPLAPHCTCSMLGISASMHAIAATPLFLIHEAYPTNPGFNLPNLARIPWEIDKDGYVGLPPGPGLGVEIDRKLLEEVHNKPNAWNWPGAKLPDGSISDY
jgi:galactonate dehydratase